MRRRTNLWHDAICEHLRQVGGPLAVEQIWERMATVGFRHASKMPRSTLGARIAELVQMKWLERVGPATYQIIDDERAMPSFSESQEEARIHAVMTKKLASEGALCEGTLHVVEEVTRT